ncbi:chitinase-3-like protein 1 isoform X1 [Drosophila mojavensis]|uniref:Uncharacterized protein, isoform B n=2 Tax=Drosophila mojavensis TaxID=7230 RepID=A0A0Q9X8J4_DROMO|nr:chitinase-3-like protein 1 isoform X1 [Drosophila mojavensis]KRG04731.1 uncharacterized protein Dmoj_GI20565, isoform B [Drosophila mojavensis]
MKFLCVLIFITSLICEQTTGTKHSIFCHWNTDSYDRKGLSYFNSWTIDRKLCTHFVYGSVASLDPDGSGALKVINEAMLEGRGLLTDILSMRRDNYQAILSIGDKKGDAERFSKMAASLRKRDQFYVTLTKFLFERGFSGVLLNWEFPTQHGGHFVDRHNFITLLKELKIILDEHHFLLLVTVSARLDKNTLAAYDIPRIAKIVDFIILNSHDSHDIYAQQVNYMSPLRGNGSQSVELGIKHWVKQSKMPQKLILGIPLFGQTYTLRDQSKTNVNAPSKGPGLQHVSSKRPGYMTYAEFCSQASKWTKKFDKQAHVPYAFKADQWISYEDGSSISAKMRLVRDQRLGGAMAWSIDADDFSGRCGERYALLKVIVSKIGNPNVLTTAAPTTEGIGLCPREGLFRNMWDCQAYYECRDAQRTDYECQDGDFFDEEVGECKPAEQVKCSNNFVTWRPGQDGYNFRDLPLNLKVVD